MKKTAVFLLVGCSLVGLSSPERAAADDSDRTARRPPAPARVRDVQREILWKAFWGGAIAEAVLSAPERPAGNPPPDPYRQFLPGDSRLLPPRVDRPVRDSRQYLRVLPPVRPRMLDRNPVDDRTGKSQGQLSEKAAEDSSAVQAENAEAAAPPAESASSDGCVMIQSNTYDSDGKIIRTEEKKVCE